MMRIKFKIKIGKYEHEIITNDNKIKIELMVEK